MDEDELLDELYEMVLDEEAEVYVDDVPWGRQARIDFEGPQLPISREEHEMKKAVLEYNDVLIEMEDASEDMWGELLNEAAVEDETRREQLRTFAE